MKRFLAASGIVLLLGSAISFGKIAPFDFDFDEKIVVPEKTSKYHLIPPTCILSQEALEIEFDIPLIGKVLFRSVKTSAGKEGMEAIVTPLKKPIVIGPLTIHNTGKFSFADGKISFIGTATLDLGYKKFEAKIGLREFDFDQEKTYESAGGVKRIERVAARCIFGIELVGEGSALEIIPGLAVTAKSFDLVLSEKPPSLTLRGFIGKAPVVLETILDINKRELKMEGALSQCRLIDIAPFFKNSPLETFSFDGAWHLTSAGAAHFEGRLYGDTPKEKAIIEPFTGLKLSFDSITFDYKKDRSADIVVKTTFMGAKVDYTGTYDVKTHELLLTGQMKDLHLTDLLTVFRDTDFKNIVFNAEAQLSSKKGLTLRGRLQDEKLKTPLYGLLLRNVRVDCETEKQKCAVTGEADILGLPVSVSFGLGWGAQTGVILSAGVKEGVESWQPFRTILKKGDPKEDDKLEILRAITVENPKLRVSLGLATGEVEQPAKKLVDKKYEETGSEQETTYIVLEDLKTKGTHIGLTVSGKMRAGKLLADVVKEAGKITQLNSDIFGLIRPKDITVDAVFKIGISQGQKFNVVGFLYLPEGFNLIDILPPKEEFEKSLGEKKGLILYQILTLVRMDYGKLVVCLNDETIDGVKYKSGLSIDTNIAIGDNIQQSIFSAIPFLKSIFEKKGERGAGFRFLCSFDPLNPKNFVLKIGLTTGDITLSIPKITKALPSPLPSIDIGPFDFSNGVIDFLARGDGVGAAVSFVFLPHEEASPKQQPIRFSGELKATPTAIGVELSSAGIWHNPFGIEKLFKGGFAVGNIGFKISETYDNFVEIPASYGLSLLAVGALGFSGEVSMGKTKPLKLWVFFKLGKDLTDFALEIGLRQPEELLNLLQGFAEMLKFGVGRDNKPTFDLSKLIVGRVNEASLKLTPFGGNIGEVDTTTGVGGALLGELFGMPMGAMLSINSRGIKMHGYLPDVKISFSKSATGPYLLITHAGGSGVDLQKLLRGYFDTRVPSQIGPEFNFTLTLDELPQLKMNGEVRLNLDDKNVLFRSLTDIELSTSRLAFKTIAQVGPDWAGMQANITASTVHLDSPIQFLRDIQPEKLSLEIEFTNTLSDAILRVIKTDKKVPGVVAALLPYIEKLIKLGNVKKIYWKGTLADLSKGRIPGIKGDIEINGKVFQGNLGDLDFRSPGDFNRSVAQIWLNLLRIGGAVLQEFLGITVFIPPCAPSVLVECQNQRKDLEVSVTEQQEKITTKVPWWKTKGYKGYEIVDTLCQNKPEESGQPEVKPPSAWLGIEPPAASAPDTRKTYTVTINNKPVIQISCLYSSFRKDGKENIEVEISRLDPDGTAHLVATQKNYGDKIVDFSFAGLAPFVFKVEVIRQFGLSLDQAKIKFYVQACTVNAWVEVIKQQKVPLQVVDMQTGQSFDIPYYDTKDPIFFTPLKWATLAPICRSPSGVIEKFYKLIVNGAPLAMVKCQLSSDGRMATQIRTPDNSRCLRDSAGTGQNIKHNFGSYTVSSEGINEAIPSQSKFRLYLQENSWKGQGPTC